MLHLMQMFYDQQRMVRFVDPEMGNVPWEFSGADILGDFDIAVSLEPRETQTREAQRQEASVALNVLGPLAQPGPNGSSIIDPARLAAWFMRKYGFARRDIAELLNSEGEQQDQTAQALAVQQAAAAAGQAPGAHSAMTGAPAVSPEAVAGASGFAPGSPAAVQEVSQSKP
jgi:hypothetical protein